MKSHDPEIHVLQILNHHIADLEKQLLAIKSGIEALLNEKQGKHAGPPPANKVEFRRKPWKR